MAQFQKLPGFVEHLAHGVHNFNTSGNGGHQLKVALSNTAPSAESTPPSGTTAACVLANVTQINYTNGSLSSRDLSISGTAQAAGVYKLSITDLVISASTTTSDQFRYIYVYNDTPTSPTDPLIGYYDYGASITLQPSDTFTIDFDSVNGVLTLT